MATNGARCGQSLDGADDRRHETGRSQRAGVSTHLAGMSPGLVLSQFDGKRIVEAGDRPNERDQARCCVDSADLQFMFICKLLDQGNVVKSCAEARGKRIAVKASGCMARPVAGQRRRWRLGGIAKMQCNLNDLVWIARPQ